MIKPISFSYNGEGLYRSCLINFEESISWYAFLEDLLYSPSLTLTLCQRTKHHWILAYCYVHWQQLQLKIMQMVNTLWFDSCQKVLLEIEIRHYGIKIASKSVLFFVPINANYKKLMVHLIHDIKNWQCFCCQGR